MGLVSASIILAEALGVVRDFEVIQTQFYAASISGGASAGDVVISGQSIVFPWVQNPNLLVAMAQDAVLANAGILAPGCRVIVDDIYVTDVSPLGDDPLIHWAPLTRVADEVGYRRCANIVALGALSRLTGLLELEQISQAVSARAPGNRDTNLKALRAGYDLELTPV